MAGSMRFVATGDSFITRRLPDTPELREITALVKSAEACLTNFEVVTPGDAFPNAVSGGTWSKAPYGVIPDLQALGFNLFGWANNHTLDYAYDGLANTYAAFERYGAVHAGVGRNLAEAAKPRYLEAPSGRVALISITSTFHETNTAGQQRPDMQGRPGVNMLRSSTVYTLPPADLERLKALADAAGVNDNTIMRIKSGLLPPLKDGVVAFGAHRFRAGDAAGTHTTANAADVARTVAGISEARRQGDYVVISLHGHEMTGSDKRVPARFLVDFARACIDAGAHAVVAHGPHVMRGVEVYKGRPILHGLGNFIFQNELIDDLPQDFYEKWGLGLTDSVADGVDKRNANNTIGFPANPWIWKSVIARWEMEGESLKSLELVPIEMGYGQHRSQRGTPKLSNDPSILAHLAELSEPFGTRIEVADGVGRVVLAGG